MEPEPIEAILRDGTSITIRGVVPEDRRRVIALFGRMSPCSIRHRYFGAKYELNEADLRYLTDNGKDVALAATVRRGDDETILGIGRYVVLSPGIAEVAFDVGDADQGRGIGTLLLEHLARIARNRGISTLRAEVEPDNGRMLEVFECSGLEVHESIEEGTCHVDMPVSATDTFVRAVAARQRIAADARRRLQA